jgi:hypothetical protein
MTTWSFARTSSKRLAMVGAGLLALCALGASNQQSCGSTSSETFSTSGPVTECGQAPGGGSGAAGQATGQAAGKLNEALAGMAGVVCGPCAAPKSGCDPTALVRPGTVSYFVGYSAGSNSTMACASLEGEYKISCSLCEQPK